MPSLEPFFTDAIREAAAKASETFQSVLTVLLTGAVSPAAAPKPRAAKDAAPRKAATYRGSGIAPKEKAAKLPSPAGAKPRARGGKSAPTEVWLGDSSVRRLPRWLMDQSGLATKRELIERFGSNASFHQGEPLPTPVGGGRNETRPRSSRPPESDEDQGQRSEATG